MTDTQNILLWIDTVLLVVVVLLVVLPWTRR